MLQTSVANKPIPIVSHGLVVGLRKVDALHQSGGHVRLIPLHVDLCFIVINIFILSLVEEDQDNIGMLAKNRVDLTPMLTALQGFLDHLFLCPVPKKHL